MSKRSLTHAQITRRKAILARLRQVEIATASEIRAYLARHEQIYVTIDTVGRDLNAMKEADTVVRGRHPTAGHTMGNTSWVTYPGWSVSKDQ